MSFCRRIWTCERRCPQRPEASAPREVELWETLRRFRELNLGLLEGQPVLVTSESSFQTGSSSLKLMVIWLHLWATVRATIYEHLDLAFLQFRMNKRGSLFRPISESGRWNMGAYCLVWIPHVVCMALGGLHGSFCVHGFYCIFQVNRKIIPWENSKPQYTRQGCRGIFSICIDKGLCLDSNPVSKDTVTSWWFQKCDSGWEQWNHRKSRNIWLVAEFPLGTLRSPLLIFWVTEA